MKYCFQGRKMLIKMNSSRNDFVSLINYVFFYFIFLLQRSYKLRFVITRKMREKEKNRVSLFLATLFNSDINFKSQRLIMI